MYGVWFRVFVFSWQIALDLVKERSMRTLLIRTFAGLAVLVSFLPFSASPANSAWANPFMMRIVDAQSGEGLSRVRVTSDEGYVCYTRADGSVLWTESSLMGRDVRFRIDGAGARNVVTAHVIPGGHAQFTVQ
jgi:hypothetical protein